MSLTEKNLEVAEFLKSQSIFQVLEGSVLESLSILFSEIDCGPGYVVFKEGDTPDGIYLVKSGAVAVIRDSGQVIAYLTAGECFGEMAIVQEGPRTATVRVPEEAVVLRLPTAALREVTRKFPAISSKIADVINNRLANDGTPFKPPGLQGNLAFFDLPTVIQTVIGSRQDGILSLYGRNGRVVGRLIMAKSAIAAATFDHLRGENALYELMNITEPLDFTFESVPAPEDDLDKDLIRRPPHMLLIEGARRADELPKLIKLTGWPLSIYNQLKTVPDLNAFGNKELTRTLWTLIEMGCNTESICRQTSSDRYSVLNQLSEFLNANWIERMEGPKPVDELRRKTGSYSKPTLEDLKRHAAAARRPEKGGGESGSRTKEHSFELIKSINSLNGVASNLGNLYGKEEVRNALEEALQKAWQTFPVLKGLRVQADSPCIDMRGASAEFSRSPDAITGLLYVGNHLMHLLVKLHNIN